MRQWIILIMLTLYGTIAHSLQPRSGFVKMYMPNPSFLESGGFIEIMLMLGAKIIQRQ